MLQFEWDVFQKKNQLKCVLLNFYDTIVVKLPCLVSITFWSLSLFDVNMYWMLIPTILYWTTSIDRICKVPRSNLRSNSDIVVVIAEVLDFPQKNPYQKKMRWSKMGRGAGGVSVFLLKVKKTVFMPPLNSCLCSHCSSQSKSKSNSLSL